MLCEKCGHEVKSNVAFCPLCGEKMPQEAPRPEEQPGYQGEGPIYQVDVKGLLRSGRLAVYRDRTEFVTGVQRTVFNYIGLVSIKKGWDCIDFIMEDGRTESCPAGRKTVHEAFMYVEQAARPYISQRQNILMSQGVRYSFPSTQGIMNTGVLNLSAHQAEFRAKSGKNDVIPYQDVKSVGAPAGTLDFLLFSGGVKSFAIGRELRDEVLAFVADSIAPYLAQRKADLLAQGIYFSFSRQDSGTVNIMADWVERISWSGQTEAVRFQDVRAAGIYMGMLDLALTDGTSRTFAVDADAEADVLTFVQNAIEPYVLARTVGFDASFGIDERIEINQERGVFHIIRQGGRAISDEWPIEALTQCKWVESREMNALGSVVSGGIALFKTAAKTVGNQAAAEAEDRISCAGPSLTIRTEQGNKMEQVWFGIFSTGMNRTGKGYDQYLAEWAGLSDFLAARCPECRLIEPTLPETGALPGGTATEVGRSVTGIPQTEVGRSVTGIPRTTAMPPESPVDLDTTVQEDDLGIAKYIEGVSRFIDSCPTPMTIAFQGNRGSGERSVLKMLFNRMRGRYGDNLLWLNARQISQSESGEALSIQAGKKLVGLFNSESNPSAKNRAANIAAGVIKLVAGAIAPESSAGDNLVEGIFDRGSGNSVEQLVKLFNKQVEEKTGGEIDKVVLFMDGLDQLSPARAVELLESMRDFFDCKKCVFVIAANYNDILSGAQELFEENRAKRFFDELFKMPFRVPASSYNVQNYVRGKIEGMGFPVGDDAELDLYTALIEHSVGKDPESIDRLFRSFQLLKIMVGDEVYESRYKRLALFALLCMQTRFRDAYEYAAGMRDNVTPEFLTDLCGQSAQPWDTEQSTEEEKAAYQSFGSVFAQVVNVDGDAEISEAECRAFAEVLELSSVTSR